MSQGAVNFVCKVVAFGYVGLMIVVIFIGATLLFKRTLSR